MRKPGASLIWSVIICGVLMTIATTIATSVVKESQMGVRMDDSAKAYAAAESGQEWAKWCLSNTSCRSTINIDGVPNYEKTFDLGDSQYTVEINKNADGIFRITSIGHSHGVNREIEYTTKSSDEIVVFGNDGATEKDDLSKTFQVGSNGFSLSFDYWTDGLTENRLNLTSGTDKIEFITNIGNQAGEVDVKAYRNNGADEITASTSTNPISLYDISPYSYKNRASNRIYLYYQPSVGVKMDVYSVTGAARSCVGTKTIMFDTDSLNFAGNSLTFSSYGALINTSTDRYYGVGGNNFDNFYATGLSVGSGLPTISYTVTVEKENWNWLGLDEFTDENTTMTVTENTGTLICPAGKRVCTASFPANTVVTLTAEDAPGLAFIEWSNLSPGTLSTTTEHSVTFTANSNISWRASWDIN